MKYQHSDGRIEVVDPPCGIATVYFVSIVEANEIVRRANAFDDLLASARDALAMAELNFPPEAARGVADRARAAIAKAEG